MSIHAAGFDPLNPFEYRIPLPIIESKDPNTKPLIDSIHEAILKTKKGETPSAESPPKKSTEIDDSLIIELEGILHSQESVINEGLENLEGKELGKEGAEGLADFQELVGHYADIGNNVVEGGVKFLEKVLPTSLLENQALELNLTIFSSVTIITNIFLKALELETKGLAVICKARILNHSRKLLNQLKKELENKIKEFEKAPPSEEASSSKKVLEDIQKQLKEWELNLDQEDKKITIEKIEVGLVLPATLFGISSIVLQHLPVEHGGFAGKIGTFFGWVASIFAVALYSLKLVGDVKKFNKMGQWSEAFHKWQIANHHIPNVTEEQFAAFRQLIDQSNTIEEVRANLQPFAITLDPEISSKEELIARFEEDPSYQDKLFSAFMQAQRTFDAAASAVQKSEDLLEKRKAVAQQKMDQLASKFETLEPQIKQIKREQFDEFLNNIQQQITNPEYSPQFIRERLEKWGFTGYPSAEAAMQFKEILSDDERNEIFTNFVDWKNNSDAANAHFEAWYKAQTKESLLHSYIDHQETLELITKNTLREIIAKKHAMEFRFFDFQMTASAASFTAALILLAISGALAILGLITTPAAGVGAILIGASVGSAVVGVGMGMAGFIRSYREKPAAFMANLNIFNRLHGKIIYARLQTAVRSYFSHAKQKKLAEIAKVLYALRVAKKNENDPDYAKALKAYKEAKLDFEKSQEKIAEWSSRMQKLHERYAEIQWKDLARQAGLQVNKDPEAFDSLQRLNEALQQCDLSLLSEETKSLLAVQLGINLKALDHQMKSDPEAFKKLLQSFVALEESWLIHFIEIQNRRIDAGIIPQISMS